jgi:hypothetical protein
MGLFPDRGDMQETAGLFGNGKLGPDADDQPILGRIAGW